jgi:hypothetical protein
MHWPIILGRRAAIFPQKIIWSHTHTHLWIKHIHIGSQLPTKAEKIMLTVPSKGWCRAFVAVARGTTEGASGHGLKRVLGKMTIGPGYRFVCPSSVSHPSSNWSLGATWVCIRWKRPHCNIQIGIHWWNFRDTLVRFTCMPLDLQYVFIRVGGNARPLEWVESTCDGGGIGRQPCLWIRLSDHLIFLRACVRGGLARPALDLDSTRLHSFPLGRSRWFHRRYRVLTYVY